jgi:hypothetical protein
MRIPKSLFNGSLATAIILFGYFGTVHAQASPTPAPTPAKFKGFQKLDAIGNATEVTAEDSSCTGLTCEDIGDCNSYTFSGQISSFNSFGPAMINPAIVICVSDDTLNVPSNGNAGTSCAPASGFVKISGTGGNVVNMSLAGEICSLPFTPQSAPVMVVNTAFAIISNSPTLKTVSRGSGTLSAFFNPANNLPLGSDATFALNGNFSK